MAPLRTCLDPDVVLAFFLDALPDRERPGIEAHIDLCGDCRRVLAELARDSSRAQPETPLTPLTSGTRIGRFVVGDRQGAGGMGVVYSAYDPELDRKVALKLLRSGAHADTLADHASSRLQREAQALARLSHPNVIAVYDVGVHHGQVFIAMELVEGSTLTAWLGERPRSWREVCDMFVPAGQALAAAHAVELVHRDFKPSNVLIGRDGRVRVIDFGLARATLGTRATPDSGANALEHALTRSGTALGTPAYMAPEQHQGRPADARSDQFSFCVALYEALYGKRPFTGATLEELARQVMTAPPEPGAPNIPARLTRAVRRGLSPDPDDRYPSMTELLAELDWRPRLRTRRIGIAGGLLAAAACAAVAVPRMTSRDEPICTGGEHALTGVWDHARAHGIQTAFAATGHAFAGQAFDGVKRALDDYSRAWVSMHRDTCAATRVRGEQSVALMDLRMRCLARRRDELQALTDIFASADRALIDRASDSARTLTSLAECGHARALEGVSPPPADPEVATLEHAHARARALMLAGKLEQARQLAEPTAQRARAIGHPSLEARLLQLLGSLQESAGELAAAEQTLITAVAAAELGRDDTGRARILMTLAFVVGYRRSESERGLGFVEQAEAVIRRIGGDAEAEARLANIRGVLQMHGGEPTIAVASFERARELWRKVPHPPPLELAGPPGNLAIVLRTLGRNDESLAHLLEAEAIVRQVAGPRHPEAARLAMNRGVTLSSLGRFAEAQQAYQSALAIQQEVFGPDSWQVALCRSNLGFALEAQGQYQLALDEHRRAHAAFESTYGAEHPQTALASYGVASALVRLGQFAEALPWLESDLAIKRKTLAADHPDLASTLLALGAVHMELGQPRRALALYHQARAITERTPRSSLVAGVLAALGEAQLALGTPREALENLERAAALHDSGGKQNVPDWDAATTSFQLARALWTSRQHRVRALELARDARQHYARLDDVHARDVQRVESWLAKHDASAR